MWSSMTILRMEMAVGLLRDVSNALHIEYVNVEAARRLDGLSSNWSPRAGGGASVYLYLSPRASGVAFTYWSCIPGAKAGVKLEAEHAVVRVVAQVVFSKFEQRLHLGPVIAPVRRSYSERSCQTWLLH